MRIIFSFTKWAVILVITLFLVVKVLPPVAGWVWNATGNAVSWISDLGDDTDSAAAVTQADIAAFRSTLEEAGKESAEAITREGESVWLLGTENIPGYGRRDVFKVGENLVFCGEPGRDRPPDGTLCQKVNLPSGGSIWICGDGSPQILLPKPGGTTPTATSQPTAAPQPTVNNGNDGGSNPVTVNEGDITITLDNGNTIDLSDLFSNNQDFRNMVDAVARATGGSMDAVLEALAQAIAQNEILLRQLQEMQNNQEQMVWLLIRILWELAGGPPAAATPGPSPTPTIRFRPVPSATPTRGSNPQPSATPTRGGYPPPQPTATRTLAPPSETPVPPPTWTPRPTRTREPTAEPTEVVMCRPDDIIGASRGDVVPAGYVAIVQEILIDHPARFNKVWVSGNVPLPSDYTTGDNWDPTALRYKQRDAWYCQAYPTRASAWPWIWADVLGQAGKAIAYTDIDWAEGPIKACYTDRFGRWHALTPDTTCP